MCILNFNKIYKFKDFLYGGMLILNTFLGYFKVSVTLHVHPLGTYNMVRCILQVHLE